MIPGIPEQTKAFYDACKKNDSRKHACHFVIRRITYRFHFLILLISIVYVFFLALFPKKTISFSLIYSIRKTRNCENNTSKYAQYIWFLHILFIIFSVLGIYYSEKNCDASDLSQATEVWCGSYASIIMGILELMYFYTGL